MASQRPLATLEETNRAIKKIRAYYDCGWESLQQPDIPIKKQAAELDWDITKLGKARQFAKLETGYSEIQLHELFDLLLEYRPVFGISHIGLLVTVSWPEREQLQSECIENNWSLKDLRPLSRSDLAHANSVDDGETLISTPFLFGCLIQPKVADAWSLQLRSPRMISHLS